MSTPLAAGSARSGAPLEAGMGLRLAALLLDAAIALLAFALLNVVLSKFGVLASLKDSQISPLVEFWQHAGPWIPLIVAICLLVVLMWSLAAGTPGALLMGVNIVCKVDGRRVGLARSVCRLIVSVGLVGVGFIGASRGQRALHDRICGTRTVRENELTHSIADYAARVL